MKRHSDTQSRFRLLWWHDWLDAVITTISVLIQAPLCSLGLIFVLAAWNLSYIVDDGWLKYFAELAVWIDLPILMALCIKTRWVEFDGLETTTSRSVDFIEVPQLALNWSIYPLIVAIATSLFLLPGLLVLVWLSLSAPVIVLEKRQMFDAFDKSYRLVHDKFWTVCLYQLFPALLISTIYVVVSVFSYLIYAMDESAYDSVRWIATDEFYELLTYFGNLSMVLICLTMSILQVNVYRFLCNPCHEDS